MQNKEMTLKELEKRMQRLIKENDQLYHLKKLYMHIPKPMILLDDKYRFVDANPAACDLFETELSDLLSKPLYDYIYFSPKDHWYLRDSLRDENAIYFSGILLELQNGRLKQAEIYALGEVSPDKQLYVLKEISDSKPMDKKQTRILQDFEKIFDQLIEGLILFDGNKTIIDTNQSFCKSMGKDKKDVVGRSLEELFPRHTKDFEGFRDQLNANGSFYGEVELSMGMTVKPFAMSAIKDIFSGIHLAILHDISERKCILDEKLNGDEKYRKVFHGSYEGLLLWKVETIESDNFINILDLNQAGIKILQLDKGQYDKRDMEKLIVIHEEEKISFLDFIKNTCDVKEGTMIKMDLPSSIRDIMIVTQKNIFQDVHLTILRDVTERQQMEDQLRKTDMLNLAGELAAGIAHEIRNPMTSLKGFIQLLQGSVEGQSMYFNIIMSELERIESIIEEFLLLAKPQAIEYKKFNVVQVMRETIELLKAQALMDNVQLRIKYVSEQLYCYGEPNQIKQVFINMIKNAIEVMSKGGIVTVKIRKVNNKLIRVSIKDQGMGIDRKGLEKLGEPFYTTKEKGTGLGLMVSYKIIREHGGKIEVESTVGKGTVFHVFLPLNNPPENHY